MDGGEIFRTRSDRPWGQTSHLYNENRVCPEGKAAGSWRFPPTPCSAEVKERVEIILYSLRTFVACCRLNFIFTFASAFTCMDEVDGWLYVWVRVHTCIHTYMYTSMNECLRMCYLRLCLYVWLYVRMTVCVHTIHIYTFRLYSGAVFHGYGTFILRSTDGYLALCGIKCDINRTLCFQHLVLVRVSWCNLNRQQCTSHRCCLPSLSHSPLLPHQSVCF